jgi:UDP-N-acetylglucosamine diphosphorylase / glucose-1-phosphate thymidylyltransferase / UDP-N-acetylgalactosamine diphosphorylase / glucosamine-1-phosphate N-acetyltransferase / galactosamine-1-phosphate N-acetyltransferase
MRPVYLYDDGLPLAPLTDLRPAFDIRSGALTNFERAERSWGRKISGIIVPEGLEGVARELHPGIPVNAFDETDADAILISGRWIDCGFSESIRDLEPRSALVAADGTLLAACGPVRDFPRLARDSAEGYTTSELQSGPVRLLSRPWHVRTFRDHAIACDLRMLLAAAGRIGPGTDSRHPMHVDPSATLSPAAIIDAEQGPVYIGAHATIRPGAIIIGPAYIGPHSTVLERATIRPNTAIGPWCKVNGEISGTIFQGYTNKAHDGFLGDSWVGQWVNLGAGTTNSNLLNTYGEVSAQAVPDGVPEPTGEQFLGAIIGDHITTAICTRLMTGAVIQTGAMLAQSAAARGCIPRFSWITDEGQQHYRAAKFLEMVKAMMARRNVTPSPAYLDRIADLQAKLDPKRQNP